MTVSMLCVCVCAFVRYLCGGQKTLLGVICQVLFMLIFEIGSLTWSETC